MLARFNLRRRWRAWRGAVIGGLVTVLTIIAVVQALAVHDLGLFELDGNATDESSVAGDDWATLYGGGGNKVAFTGITVDKPPDATYFTQGSKDTEDIPKWRYSATKGGIPDKDEITNAYAAAYIVPSGPKAGHLIIYFGMDRFATDGNANVGFWFFQNPVGLNPDGTFSGTHQVGDFLILSTFTQGGTVPTIQVYEWVGSGGSDGALNLKFSGTNADCTTVGSGDDACATVNSSPTTAPWAYTPKSGPPGIFPAGGFFEGGIDVTAIFGQNICVTRFLAETRSSQSLTATLHDFAGPTPFNVCASITGHKYHDRNGNGQEDTGEPALSGWTIFLDANNNGALDQGERSGTTDSGGNVTFANLTPGTYRVCEVPQSGWITSDPGDGTNCKSVTLGLAGTVTVKFGNFQNATKSGRKFNDLNANGTQDAGEAGLSGWEIHLFGTDGRGNSVHQHATTDSTGAYSFTVPPGTYTVCETLQPGWTQTFPTTGADCSAHGGGKGYSITLTSGQQDTDNHFGNRQLFKKIVIVCNQDTNTLVESQVTLGATTKTTISAVPSSLSGKGVSAQDLCAAFPTNLSDNGTFGDLPAGTYTESDKIPK